MLAVLRGHAVDRHVFSLALGGVAVRIVRLGDYDANGYGRGHLQRVLAVAGIEHPLRRVAFVRSQHDVHRRPTRAHRKLQRPRLSALIDDAVHINVAKVAQLNKRVLKRVQHLVKQFRGVGVLHHRAGLTAVGAAVAGQQLLVLKVFVGHADKSFAAHPAAYRKFFALNKLLQNARAFELHPHFLPALKPCHQIGGRFRAIRKGLVFLAAESLENPSL